MITIPKKLWYVVNQKRDNLSYMCPYEVTKEGEPNAATKKMQATGRSWAGKNPDFISDNTPVTGIYIGCSVERYSTSNKLFRVTDPRGFVVEVPTDNIATLLHLTTVIKGVVQEECVWARDGGHILLPVNSELYRKSEAKQTQLKSGLVPNSSLVPGDIVHEFAYSGAEGMRSQYIGRVKCTWSITRFTQKSKGYRGIWGSTEWGPLEQQETEAVEDPNWVYVFLRNNRVYVETAPKITVIVENKTIPELDLAELLLQDHKYGLPERVMKRLSVPPTDGDKSHYGDVRITREWKLESYKFKE